MLKGKLQEFEKVRKILGPRKTTLYGKRGKTKTSTSIQKCSGRNAETDDSILVERTEIECEKDFRIRHMVEGNHSVEGGRR